MPDSLLIKDAQIIQDYYSIQATSTENSKFIDMGLPVSVSIIKHNYDSEKNTVFYILTGLVLLLGILKFLYYRYFQTLFRVFFNASLRQSQLTDQLLIAKLQSLIFNIFFVITSGLYIYFLLRHFTWILPGNMEANMLSSIGIVGLIYIVKYLSLKFTGWLTGYKQETTTYIFVIFLINKIIGILLVPFIIVVAFSDEYLVRLIILVSLLLIIILLILRFLRSYQLVHHNLKITRYHFLLYIIGVEIIPLLVVYKALLIFFIKNS